jgi:glycosyltransferase involved in cell wall biosynthesis
MILPRSRLPTLALAFATIERAPLVQRFVRSVRTRFPALPIYVADQSRQIDAMRSFYAEHDINLVRMPFDAGVCAARNRLVAEIKEDYFVLSDDDFLFEPGTDFADAITILEAQPEIAVVGGCLHDTSGPVEYIRHWEMYLEYDSANRLLISIPMYDVAPVIRTTGGIEFCLCDTVMNFAVFRRSIFSERICWDERYKSNGEHDDFYLNLKQNSPYRVAYLPTLVAEHNHLQGFKNYDTRLRGRTEGWRRFMLKWKIDQYLEIGLGLRHIDDPGVVAGPQETTRRYRVETVAAPKAPSDDLWSITQSHTVADLRRLRLFFRYDPIFKPDSDFILWYRTDPSAGATGSVADVLAVRLRWFAADGRPLIWETERVVIELRETRYWQPLLVDVPLVPRGCTWLRYEIVAELGRARIPIAIGFVIESEPWAGERANDLPSCDVLALSRLQDLAGELPVKSSTCGGVEDLAKESDGVALPVRSLEAGSAHLLLLCSNQVPALTALLFRDWPALSSRLVTARLPGPELGAPTLIAVPDPGPAPVSACIIGSGSGGNLFLLLVRRPAPALSAGCTVSP